MMNNSQFLNKVLTGNGTILNLLNNYFKIWFMIKVYFSILKIKRNPKKLKKMLNNLVMDPNTKITIER
jgi:hypothetical protein